MPIKNDMQMITMLGGIASKVIFKVSGDMLEVLANYIMKETYGDLPNIFYYNGSGMPTFQFLEAFKLTNVQQKLNEIVTELYYSWQSMDYDADTFLHGSPYNGDMREKLAEILNVDGSTGFSNKIRQPYWDDFIIDMFDRGGLTKLFDKYMKEEFGKVGIIITKG